MIYKNNYKKNFLKLMSLLYLFTKIKTNYIIYIFRIFNNCALMKHCSFEIEKVEHAYMSVLKVGHYFSDNMKNQV